MLCSSVAGSYFITLTWIEHSHMIVITFLLTHSAQHLNGHHVNLSASGPLSQGEYCVVLYCDENAVHV